jgi:hypothetical protein
MPFLWFIGTLFLICSVYKLEVWKPRAHLHYSKFVMHKECWGVSIGIGSNMQGPSLCISSNTHCLSSHTISIGKTYLMQFVEYQIYFVFVI